MKYIRRICVLLVFLSIHTSYAQIVLDASSSKTGISVSSLTWTHTVSSPADILIVTVTSKDKTISSVKCNGANMALVGSRTRNSMIVAMYCKILPTWGTNTIVVTTTGGTDLFAGAESYANVDYTNPISGTVTADGKSTAASVVVSSNPGDLVVDAVGCISANLSPGASQSQKHSVGSSCKNGSSTRPGGTTVSMLWNLSANEDWAIVSISLKYLNTLPIELLSFTAVPAEGCVKLNWVTATEINNDYYTIEHSLNSIDFMPVGTVNATGNSLTQTAYSFPDKNPFTGISYYRLKQTDFDSTFSYSQIIAINMKEIEIVSFYPNPAVDVSNIYIVSPSEKNVQFNVSSADGKILVQDAYLLREGMNIIRLNVSEYAQGNYIFTVKDQYQTYSAKQFFIR